MHNFQWRQLYGRVLSLVPSYTVVKLGWSIKNTTAVQTQYMSFESISHSKSFMITISPTYLFIWKKITFILKYFRMKNLPTDYPCKSHDHDNQLAMAWLPYDKRKCEHKVVRLVWEFYSVHANESIGYIWGTSERSLLHTWCDDCYISCQAPYKCLFYYLLLFINRHDILPM